MVYQLAIFLLLVMNVLDVTYTLNVMTDAIDESNAFALWLITNYGFEGLLIFKTLMIGVLFVASRFIEDCSIAVRWFFWIAISVYFVLTLFHLIIKIFVI